MVTADGNSADTLVGKPMKRKEDLRLLTGRGRFVEDIHLPGMVYVRVLRSPHAHARLKRLDIEPARSMPGVHGVLCGKDLKGKLVSWGGVQKALAEGERFPFALEKVVYEGQEIAAVAADTKHQAQDAIEAIDVEYELLPAVIDPEAAMSDGSPLVIEGIDYADGQRNVEDVYRARIGDIRRAEREAAVHVRGIFRTNRPHACALEVHGAVADYDADADQLTIYTSTQSVHIVRDLLAQCLQTPANRIRALAGDVGGGFGSKCTLYQHEVIASVFSMMLGRPVQFVLSRSDSFRATTARCNQVRHAELFAAEDGTILGYRDRIVHNCGANSTVGSQVLKVGTHVGLSAYAIPNVYIDGYAVRTNTIAGGAVRGFGVPQTVFAVEQLVDMAAHQLGMDPAEMRLRNVPRDEECPVIHAMGHRIDSTSIAACVEKSAEEIGWHQRRKMSGVGYGLAIALKYTSCRHPDEDSDLSSVRMKIEADGTVSVYSSDGAQGQGHETMISQIVGDILGIEYDRIRVHSSDTETSLFGLGTWGSRGAAILGAAAQRSAERVRDKMLRLASHLLEVSPDDLEVGGDRIRVRGTHRGLTVAELAAAAGYSTHSLPSDFEPGSLEAAATYDSPTELLTDDGYGNISITYSGAAHAAKVAVDLDTGIWKIVDYVMVHDSGVVVNPLIVDGQHQGGFLHGYGMAFGEGIAYDDEGRVTNPTFATYYAPYAPDVPSLSRLHELAAPSRAAPGGRKGAGESATSPPPAAIANALYDATGIRFTMLPITPDHVLAALREKERCGVESLVYPHDAAHPSGSAGSPGRAQEK